MGTSGYYVYRYRKIFFIYYVSSDHQPRGLGIKMLQHMRQPNAIAKERQRFEGILRKLCDPSYPRESDDVKQARFYDELDFIAQKRRPQNDSLIEWIYEIDLDRNIYYINAVPFFSLECLPSDEDFLDYISTDHYGNLTCSRRCPPEHKYKRPAPPAVDDSDLVTYKSLECGGTDVPLSDLLAINEVLTPDEHVRLSLLEIMIGQCMFRPGVWEMHKQLMPWPHVGQMICDLEVAFDHNRLTNQEWSTACSIASLAFIPQIFDTPSSWIYHPELKRKEFTWVREDTVVRIATHLDDERCLHSCISRLIDEILEQKDNPGYYFGVAFSVYHCAIVKVAKDIHAIKFSHTPALQFLPSFYAYSPSTPGITALTRLGYRVDPALFARATKICGWLRFRMTTHHTNNEQPLAGGADDEPEISCEALPFELWREIALHLHFRDLISFGLVSKLCREVASVILRHPHVGGYRLVAVPKQTPKNLRQRYRFLRAASFVAARGGIPATVVVGLGSSDCDNIRIPFGYDSSFSDHSIYMHITAEVAKEATPVGEGR